MNQATTSDQIAWQRLHPAIAILIVFLSNFCILVLELVAGRLMAPRVGVNLYTWTSVIGVILAGISLGNYLGGKIADRHASRSVLAGAFILSAFASASVLGVVMLIGSPPAGTPVILGVLGSFIAVFLLPSTIMGTISPVVVKLTLVDLQRTGDIVGKIYAAGAAGSIAGTFATGFFLISRFGTRTIIWGVAAVLLLIGVLLVLSTHRRSAVLFLVIFLGTSVLAGQVELLGSECLRETNYYCIKVQTDDDEPSLRLLLLDRLLHSIVDLENPTRLLYRYENVYADVVNTVYPARSPLDVLFIGGGGYVFPRYMEENFSGSRIDVVEIDPGVTAVNFTELGLSSNTTITSYNEDARRFVNSLPAEVRYDIILGDAFNDVSVPYHLTTLEFNEMIARHLNEQGVYLVNIIDGRSLDFFRAYVHTLQQTFAYVYASPVGIPPGTTSRQTFVLVATQHNLDELVQNSILREQFLSRESLADYMQQDSAVLLTDDFVPVDNLLEPVLRDSGY